MGLENHGKKTMSRLGFPWLQNRGCRGDFAPMDRKPPPSTKLAFLLPPKHFWKLDPHATRSFWWNQMQTATRCWKKMRTFVEWGSSKWDEALGFAIYLSFALTRKDPAVKDHHWLEDCFANYPVAEVESAGLHFKQIPIILVRSACSNIFRTTSINDAHFFSGSLTYLPRNGGKLRCQVWTRWEITQMSFPLEELHQISEKCRVCSSIGSQEFQFISMRLGWSLEVHR